MKGSHHASDKLIQGEGAAGVLISLPLSGISIYPTHITQYSISASHLKSMGSSVTQTTMQELETSIPLGKTIYFSRGDVAFKAVTYPGGTRISIIRLKDDIAEIEFEVQSARSDVIVNLLRRKMCELGFQEKYTKIKELGKGATAMVYLVERKADKQLFAAKVISLRSSEHKDYQTFINETKILRALSCPQIVHLQSLYISKKQLVAEVLEYLSGGTLLELLRKEVLKSHKDKLEVIKDLTLAVEHLRLKRIVHRDIKLENIMIREGRLGREYVLTDFGLACWIGEKELIYQKCGTPGYIAPEVLRAGKGNVIISHAMDVFSLGVIFHFVLLMRALFSYSGDTKQLLIANKKAEFTLEGKVYSKLRECELNLLKKTLVIDPEKRVHSKELLEVWIKKCEDVERASITPSSLKIDRALSQNSQRESERERKMDTSKRNNHLQASQAPSIELVEARNPSLTKRTLSISMRQKPVDSPGKHRASSARKVVERLWEKFTGKSDMKVKENRGDRRKEMLEYIE